MPTHLSNSDIVDVFKKAGIVCPVEVSICTDTKGVSKGFGWAYFPTTEEAKEAITLLNHKELAGKKLYLDLVRCNSRVSNQKKIKRKTASPIPPRPRPGHTFDSIVCTSTAS